MLEPETSAAVVVVAAAVVAGDNASTVVVAVVFVVVVELADAAVAGRLGKSAAWQQVFSQVDSSVSAGSGNINMILDVQTFPSHTRTAKNVKHIKSNYQAHQI